MQGAKWMFCVALTAVMVVSSGCQLWQKKYEICRAEQENLQALFDSAQQSLQRCDASQQQLEQQLAQAQQALAAELQKPSRQPGQLEREGGVYDERRGTITVTLESDVLFDSGKAVLKSSYTPRLKRLAEIIKADYGGREVWVIGHTDQEPITKSKWNDNWQLSTERALAVTRMLIKEGVSAKQLVAAGRGEHHPVQDGKSQRVAANRRVEIVVYTQ